MSTATESKTLQVTRSFTVGPERVFDAWLNPEMARRFLFSTPTGEMVRVEIDARVGGKFLIVRRTDGDDVEHVGEYLAIERPRRLVFTFGVPKFSTQFTQVTIEIAPTADGCTLTLTHEGVLPEWAERTQEGWGMILNGLDDTLQQPYAIAGRAGHDPVRAPAARAYRARLGVHRGFRKTRQVARHRHHGSESWHHVHALSAQLRSLNGQRSHAAAICQT